MATADLIILQIYITWCSQALNQDQGPKVQGAVEEPYPCFKTISCSWIFWNNHQKCISTFRSWGLYYRKMDIYINAAPVRLESFWSNSRQSNPSPFFSARYQPWNRPFCTVRCLKGYIFLIIMSTKAWHLFVHVAYKWNIMVFQLHFCAERRNLFPCQCSCWYMGLTWILCVAKYLMKGYWCVLRASPRRAWESYLLRSSSTKENQQGVS